MGISVPLLNEYKQDFFARRFPRTVSGGLHLKFGYPVPFYMYIAQFLVFLFPWILSAPFLVLMQLKILELDMGAYIYGIVIFIVTFSANIISLAISYKKNQRTDREKKAKIFTILDEDQISFDGFFGTNTLLFLIPTKKYKFNMFLHPVMSGLMCGLAVLYLLPRELDFLYLGNMAAVVSIFILGWLTVCIAQYSYTTTSPPELATYRALDLYELNSHTRPFYVFFFLIFYVCSRNIMRFMVWNQALHAVMVTLPLLWSLGVLPPLDALFSWLLEQAYVIILGGSPMCSDLRMVGMIIASIATVITVYLLPSSVASVCVAASMGYLLSLDVCGILSQIYTAVTHRNKIDNKLTVKSSNHDRRTKNTPCFWSCRYKEIFYHLLIVGLVFVTSFLMAYDNNPSYGELIPIFGYVVLALTILEKVSRDLQSVYLVYGTVRNVLYPKSYENQEKFLKSKRKLRPLGWCHRFIIDWGGPFIMLTYLLLIIPLDYTSPLHKRLFYKGLGHPQVSIIQCIAITRAYRSIWQSTSDTLQDITITHLIFTALPTNYHLRYLGEFVVLLLISFCRDRITQLINKFYFFALLLVTSLAHKKQRRTSSPILVSLTAILFPLVLFVIALSAFLSVPLLALFTIPVFMIGFPRPKRFWPDTNSGCGSVCPDTIYYQQLNPALKSCFRDLFAAGSIGNPSAGDYYLVRFQDKLSWLTILERGAGYCTINIKGLELQETSCHTIEASHLDTIFKSAFDNSGDTCVNSHWFSVITPLDTAFINTYSSTRNVLTGVIDSADNYELVFTHLQKTLIWVIMKHVRETKQKELARQLKQLSTYHDNTPKHSGKKSKSKDSKHLEKKGSVISIRSIGKQSRVSPVNDISDDDIVRPPTADSGMTNTRRPSHSSIHSFSESIFSDDFSESKNTTIGSRANKNWSSIKTYGSITPQQNVAVFKENLKDIESFTEDPPIGLPAVDISEIHSVPKPNPLVPKLPRINTNNGIYKPTTNLANSAEFTCPYSVNFSIPMKWRELPIDASQLQKPNFPFPFDWFCRVLRSRELKVIGKSEEEVYKDLETDEVLRDVYTKLTVACSSVFESSGLGYMSKSHKLYKCYVGELPWNAMMDWLTEERDLFALVLQAFRYAFKLMLDEFAYGPMENDEELLTYLQHYDTDWYIGQDSTTDWSDAVEAGVPNLFSLGHVTTKGVYTSRMLTTQQLPVHIGRLNPEVIRGQWANLALELYYLTNDDDERYSIQAHPSILRNLTVQAADPPLGYPIYSSQPVSIPTL